MTIRPIPARASKTSEELKSALTKALQAHPECQGIRVVKLKTLEQNQGLANWDAEFAAEPGMTMSAECKRVLLGAKHGVKSATTWQNGLTRQATGALRLRLSARSISHSTNACTGPVSSSPFRLARSL